MLVVSCILISSNPKAGTLPFIFPQNRGRIKTENISVEMRNRVGLLFTKTDWF